ncbi:MAG: hypothetical protein DGJ47_000752 [Rickettsiaceae bacterium]
MIAYNIVSNVYSSTFDIKVKLPGADDLMIIRNISIPTPGKHNVLNALAAISIGIELGFSARVIKDGFKNFAGVSRRFTKIGDYNDAEIIDDYAHHPVEIHATIDTAKSITDKRGAKVIAVFQPHRYTRLRDLFDDFAKCFAGADKVYILDVFSAGESPITNFTSKDLANKIKEQKIVNVEYLEDKSTLPDAIQKQSKKGDLILFMGAGNITYLAKEVLNILNNQLEIV